jgi:hypothetical protein
MAPTSDHPLASVVVFEKQPYWGPELQRRFADTSIVVRECRSLRDLLPATRDVASSVILLDMDAAPAECLTWLSQTGFHASPPVLIVASTNLADLEWPLRESRAVAFLHDEISGTHLAQLCLRQLRVNLTTAKISGFGE